jgi:Arc/MetJ-type ribon-helix-helix transcriptional regulator
MTIIIPDSFREFVAAQIASGLYADASSLLAALLEKEQARAKRESIDRSLLSALAGGESTEMTPQDWSEIRAELQRKHAERNGNKS